MHAQNRVGLIASSVSSGAGAYSSLQTIDSPEIKRMDRVVKTAFLHPQSSFEHSLSADKANQLRFMAAIHWSNLQLRSISAYWHTPCKNCKKHCLCHDNLFNYCYQFCCFMYIFKIKQRHYTPLTPCPRILSLEPIRQQ